MVGELSVVREQREHGNGVAQVPLRVVVLAGADDSRRDEVAVPRCRVLDEVAPEQLTDEGLEDDIRGEDRLAPVVDGRELLSNFSDPLPRRVAVPGLDVGSTVEAVDLLTEGEGCTTPDPGRYGSCACC